MFQNTTPLSYELTSTGGAKTIAITPATTAQVGTFVISGIDPKIGDNRNYLTRLYPHLLLTLDTDGAGSAVNWDQLYKGINSVELVSPVLGTVFPHKHTTGATLGHFIGFIGNGYLYPTGARTQIPTNTDADYTIDLFYILPIASECLADPMETAQWAGFFDGGTVEMIVGTTTVYDGDYAGAVIKAPTTLRCTAETMPSPKEFIGIPNQWRNRQIAGGGSSPVLKNVGGETSLNGISPGAGIAGLFWLSDATGIGLGGPDGVDNFTQLTETWRGQKVTQNLDPLFFALRNLSERNSTHVGGIGASTPLNDNAFWPSTMAATGTGADGRPSANAQQMALPLVAPGRKTMTSKVQRVLGDLQVDFGVTTAITNPHQFLTWELLEYTENQVAAMAALARFRGVAKRKTIGSGAGATESNLRYTAIEFVEEHA